MKSQKLISIGVAAVAVATIAAGSLAFQDGSDSSASALGLSDGQVTQIAATFQATPSEDREAYLQKIADNLGVDLAALKSAVGKANTDTLDEKVADGSITQERADEMRERLATGDTFFHGRGGPGHGGPGGFGGHHIDSEELAAVFGIEVETLRTEAQTKSLASIASEHGRTADELKAFLTAEKQATLAEKVAAGTITQAEADEKLAELTAGLDERINEVHRAGGPGPRGERPAAPTN